MALTQHSRRLATALAFAAAAACAHRGGNEPFATVSVEEVARMLGQPDVVVIDANTAGTYRKNHLPGAIYWKSAPFAQVLPPDKDKRLVFYCASPS